MATIWRILSDSFIQFWSIFGVFLIAGAILTMLSKWTSNALNQFRWPKFTTYFFGAIGVPVHELSHALFCRLFFHEVRKVKWFDAKAKGGTHGSVEHTYQPWNLYHRVGHFFIGLGPAILGPLLLAALFYAFVPASRPVIQHAPSSFVGLAPFFSELLHACTTRATLGSTGFWLFLYLAICICSQIELSIEDLKQVGTGIIPIFVTLILINVFAWSLGAQWHGKGLLLGSKILAATVVVFSFAAVLSAATLVICTLIFGTINRLTGHQGINPFRVQTHADKTLSNRSWTKRG